MKKRGEKVGSNDDDDNEDDNSDDHGCQISSVLLCFYFKFMLLMESSANKMATSYCSWAYFHLHMTITLK